MLVPNDEKTVAGLAAFTDEKLVESLYKLSATITKWEWLTATEAPYHESLEEIGGLLLEQLQAAAEAAAACTTTTKTRSET